MKPLAHSQCTTVRELMSRPLDVVSRLILGLKWGVWGGAAGRDRPSMPIYEYACPRCRKIFSFLSKKLNPSAVPACPKCGGRRLAKQMSRFALGKAGGEEETGAGGAGDASGMPDFDDPRVSRAMGELERDALQLDESNPKHMAHLLRKMKGILPTDTMPKEFESAIRRLEAGEDPDKIEEDMGPLLDQLMGSRDAKGSPAEFSHDPGLYDFQ